MPDTENKDSIKEVYANDYYRLDIDGGIIREIDVNIVTFINLANLEINIDINNLNDKNVFTSTFSVKDENGEEVSKIKVLDVIISKLLDETFLNDGSAYKHYRIQSTSINQLPHIDYLMEYDIYNESYMKNVILSENINTNMIGDIDNSSILYIGELHSYNDGSLTDKVLKVIFPVEFVGKYDFALIGKYSKSDGLTYSYSLVSDPKDDKKVSGIASVIYTSKSEFEGVSNLIKNIHVSNYSMPHLFQNNSLSTAANLNKLMDTSVRINERNFVNTVPYKNIIMHKDYSIQFIGNYLYGNTNSN